jgi:hypothetical protein
LACKTLTVTLTPSGAGCGAATVQPADLYALTGAAGAGSPPEGTVTLASTSSTFRGRVGGAGGIVGPLSVGPGAYRVTVTATVGGASCLAVVTVQPCRAVPVSGTIALPTAPGTCAAAAPEPALVVAAASLGQGALAVNLRRSATSTVASAPFAAGSYFVQVVYPGGVLSAVSSSAARITVADTERPVAEVKPTVARDGSGFICAKGRNARSTTACLSVSTSSAVGVITLRDNCPVSRLTRSYACSGTCPATATTARATRVCVPVVRGGARREATFTLTVTDRSGGTATLEIPVAAYHFSDAPAGVTCYSA